MTTIRKIVTSKIDGNDANSISNDEIRPFGETAFYLDNNDKLTLMMFDGVRTHLKSKVLSPGVLYGSNADAGDGSNADTIKLIPDATLYDQGSNQYIVVDPTDGEPGHIHLRAGGTQDASTADLYLGGELTCVRVSDTSGFVTVRTTNVGDPNITMDWTFETDGNLYFPGIGNNRIGESEPGLVVSSDNGVVLQSNNGGESKELSFGSNGVTTFPGEIIVNTASIKGTPSVTAAGTIISVPLNAAGDTVDYTGGASLIEVPKNTDTDQVQAGWIITFNGGDQRTVSDRIDGGSYYAITFSEANPGGTLYPLTIQSADYREAADGKIELEPDGALDPSQKLVIKGGQQEEPHLHLTTGDLQETSIFLGTDEHNVRTRQGGDIEITARNYSNDGSYVWTFDNNGTLLLPNDTAIGDDDNNGIAVTMPITSGSTNSFSWRFSDVISGINDTITLNYNLLGTNQSDWYFAVNNNTTAKYLYLDGATQSLTMLTGALSNNGKLIFGTAAGNNAGDANAIELKATDGDVYLSSTESVKITVDANDSSARVWRFDPTGELTLPLGGKIADSTDGVVSSTNFVGAPGSRVVLQQRLNESTFGSSIQFAADSDIALVVNTGSTNKVWTFDIDGDIVFPDATVQTTAWTGAADIARNIESENDISIRVNLTDSTTRIWRFGEDGVLNLPEGGDIVDSTGTSVLGGGGSGSVLEEPFESKSSATGVIEHDATTNRLFRHTSISANFTANFTNLGLTAGKATSISLVLVQGATARMCTAVQIGGAAQTITWQGSASAPLGNANRTDVVTFSILCTATDTYTVLGMLTSFGG